MELSISLPSSLHHKLSFPSRPFFTPNRIHRVAQANPTNQVDSEEDWSFLKLSDGEEDDNQYKYAPSLDWATRARNKGVEYALSTNLPTGKLQTLLSDDASKKKKKKKKIKKKDSAVLQLKDFKPKEWTKVPDSGDKFFIGVPGVSLSTIPSLNRFAQAKKERRFNADLVAADNEREVLELVRDMISQDISCLTHINVATAIHRVAKHMEEASASENERFVVSSQKEMKQLVSVAMDLISQFSAQGLSNIAWAFAKLGGRHLFLNELDTLSQAAIEKVEEFNSQNIANIAGAYASMQHSAETLFENLVVRGSTVAETFQPVELAQYLWACASLNHCADPLLDAIDILCKNENIEQCKEDKEHDIGFFDQFSLQQLANIAWSYAVLAQLHRPSFSAIWANISNKSVREGPNIQVRYLSQIHQVKMTLKLEHHFNFTLDNTVQELARKAWQKEKIRATLTSLFQKDLERLLVSTGKEWISEYDTADYTLDVALVEEKVAIEVDGPSHFDRKFGNPLGHTLLKRRLLAASGWKLISISYNDWEKMLGETERMQFLRKQLSMYL